MTATDAVTPADEAVRRVFKLWSVDEAWSVETASGFEWLPHRLLQRVEGVDSDDRVFLKAETVMVRNVRDADRAVEVAALACQEAPTFAVIFDAEIREIRASTVTSMDGYYYPTVMRFADAALRQITFAERWADHLAIATSGEVAVTAHPGSGLRSERDDMLNMVGVFALRPEHVLDGLDIQNSLGVLEQMIVDGLDLARGEGADAVRSNGVDFAFPLHRQQFDQALQVLVLRTTALRGTGPGLSFELSTPPLETTEAYALTLANELNLGSSRDLGQLCGAWLGSGNVLRYRAFVPHPVLKGAGALEPADDGIAIVDAFLRQSVFEPADRLVSAMQAHSVQFADHEDDPALSLHIVEPTLQKLADRLGRGAGTAAEDTSWLFEHDPHIPLGTWGIFNPIGPTLVQIGLVEVSPEQYLFVEWMRHPFLPSARALEVVVAPTDETIAELLQRHLVRTRRSRDESGMLSGSLPEFVILPDVGSDALREAMITVADEESTEDLAAATAQYRHYAGDAWARLSQSDEPPVWIAANQNDVGATWWDAVTDPVHVGGHIGAFASAWDGAIQFLEDAQHQESQG